MKGTIMNKQTIGAALLGITLLSSATLGATPALAATVRGSGTTARAGYGNAYGAPAAAHGAGAAASSTAAHAAVTASVAPGELSAAEVADLQYMSEEEKLAHDVYTYIYQTWGLRPFSNIAKSEQRHTDAVGTILDAVGAEDLTDGAAAGEFTDPGLQALYDGLVAQASGSAAAAYEVGVLIEETDIADLEERMAATDDVSVLQVYENLLKGSYNHLRAFSR